MGLNWSEKTYEQLTKEELYSILKLRVEVFVVEQECPYPEIDGRDPECLHIWLEDEGGIAAYCRIVPPDQEKESYSIGRVIVHKDYRGKGTARKLMEKAIQAVEANYNTDHIRLSGQEHLRGFYASFGFEEMTGVYLEDGIPHVDMKKNL